jgi:hypothetical protein
MEKEKKENCEKIKEDKIKREFIKKSLLGIGTAGIIAGVLASPLGSSITEIGDLNPGTNHVANLNADKLDSQDSTYYRCASGCTWTCTSCSTNCSGVCSTGCLSSCYSCYGSCTTDCGVGCNGCTGP